MSVADCKFIDNEICVSVQANAGGVADWNWSSYKYNELGDASSMAMDWDGKWLIVWRDSA